MKTFLLGLTVLLAGAASAPAAIVTSNVDYKDGDTELRGFLAYDDLTTEPRPAVLIVHQWMGIKGHEREVATRLAEMGYVAFCADIYGVDSQPTTTQEAAALAGRFRGGDRAELRERLEIALDVIQSHELVDADRVAAIGYCFGGTAVLEIARSGSTIDGVASFHGGLAKGEAETLPVQTKVLILHGNDDPLVPPAEVIGVAEELRDAGADYTIIGYGGAVHSFTDKSADSDAARYNEAADRRSFQALSNFLEEIFSEQ